MAAVSFVSFQKQFVILKHTPNEKVPFSDVELLRYAGITLRSRKTICEGDIVDFLMDDDIERAVVVRENDEMFFYTVKTSKKISPYEYFEPEELRGIDLVGNKYQHKDLLSEESMRALNLQHLFAVMAGGYKDVGSSFRSYCYENYCKHDIKRAMDKLPDLSKEELISFISKLVYQLKFYREELQEMEERCLCALPCVHHKQDSRINKLFN